MHTITQPTNEHTHVKVRKITLAISPASRDTLLATVSPAWVVFVLCMLIYLILLVVMSCEGHASACTYPIPLPQHNFKKLSPAYASGCTRTGASGAGGRLPCAAQAWSMGFASPGAICVRVEVCVS